VAAPNDCTSSKELADLVPFLASPMANAYLPQTVSRVGIVVTGGNVDLDALPWK
jgi:hypothetical protein